MSDLELQIKNAAEKAVLHYITQGGWIMPNYESRIKLPPEILSEAWSLVDRESLRTKLAARIEDELVDRLVNHIAAEMATDVKQILSVKERREAIRELARQHFLSVMKEPLPVGASA